MKTRHSTREILVDYVTQKYALRCLDIAIGSVPTARTIKDFVPTKLSVDGPAFLESLWGVRFIYFNHFAPRKESSFGF